MFYELETLFVKLFVFSGELFVERLKFGCLELKVFFGLLELAHDFLELLVGACSLFNIGIVLSEFAIFFYKLLILLLQ